MKISLVIILICLGCSALGQQETTSTRRSKRTAHFLLHQFADLLGYDIIPKVAVVADIRSRLGLPPLPSLAQPQGQSPQAQQPQGQVPQTQAPPRTSTVGTSTTTRAQAPSTTTAAQAPPSSEGPVRLPLPLNILNRIQPTVPILNPAVPPQSRPIVGNRIEQAAPEVGVQQTNFNLNYLFSKVPQNPTPPSAPGATNAIADGPSAEAPSAEGQDLDGPQRFFDDNNYVFNPRDANDEEFDTGLAFTGWTPPMPDDFNLAEESSEVKYNPVPTARSAPFPRSATHERLDPVAVAYPQSNYHSSFSHGPIHRRQSATSQHNFNTNGHQFGYVTYHEPQNH